jgi:hypothetical protein
MGKLSRVMTGEARRGWSTLVFTAAQLTNRFHTSLIIPSTPSFCSLTGPKTVDGAAGLRHAFRRATKAPSILIPRRLESRAQAAWFRERQAAGDTGLDPAAQLPAVRGADLRSSAYRSRAQGRRLLGRLEQPFQTEEPLFEELVAQVGQRQRGEHA